MRAILPGCCSATTGQRGRGQPDHFWGDQEVRFLTGNHRGTPAVILGVVHGAAGSDTKNTIVVRETYTNELNDIAVGDYLSMGSIPFAVLGAPLESADGVIDPLLKRHVTSGAAIVFDPRGLSYTRHGALGTGSTFPLGQVGVIDYSGLANAAPAAAMPDPSLVMPGIASDWVRRTRYSGTSPSGEVTCRCLGKCSARTTPPAW